MNAVSSRRPPHLSQRRTSSANTLANSCDQSNLRGRSGIGGPESGSSRGGRRPSASASAASAQPPSSTSPGSRHPFAAGPGRGGAMSLGRSLLLGANAPKYLVECTRGGGTMDASRRKNCRGGFRRLQLADEVVRPQRSVLTIDLEGALA